MRLGARFALVLIAGLAPSGPALAASIDRDGWILQHELSASDGLRVFDASFAGQLVLRSVGLVEWHADGGSSGFVLSTGAGGSGGGFPIAAFGSAAVFDLFGAGSEVVGFELVQDFRMPSWGAFCNYRFEQRLQFFQDGRFRVLSGAYGKGCSDPEVYRPVVRIDVAVDGDDGDSLSRWSGSEWLLESEEGIWTQVGHPLSGDAAWRVDDEGGAGLLVAPGIGDEAWLYATRRKPAEGDADLAVIGDCCNDDDQQGPDTFVDGESIAGADLVLWYVPQMRVDSRLDDGDGYACWTIQGEPSPETYPCFAGPTFVPIEVPEPLRGAAAALAALALVAAARRAAPRERRSRGAGGEARLPSCAGARERP
jgi:hypothetical protein